ncbi:hypothetical protein O4H61_05265 [Roseovarius aestuarii]|nr:hypothetical protein [Roseovarius aestuarii]
MQFKAVEPTQTNSPSAFCADVDTVAMAQAMQQTDGADCSLIDWVLDALAQDQEDHP